MFAFSNQQKKGINVHETVKEFYRMKEKKGFSNDLRVLQKIGHHYTLLIKMLTFVASQ